MEKKKSNIPIILFIILSFIILPAVAFPVLIHINQVDRFSFVFCGYLGIATQVVSFYLREARIWRLRFFDFSDEKPKKKRAGKWINVIILTTSITLFCYGIYHIFFGWNSIPG